MTAFIDTYAQAFTDIYAQASNIKLAKPFIDDIYNQIGLRISADIGKFEFKLQLTDPKGRSSDAASSLQRSPSDPVDESTDEPFVQGKLRELKVCSKGVTLMLSNIKFEMRSDKFREWCQAQENAEELASETRCCR